MKFTAVKEFFFCHGSLTPKEAEGPDLETYKEFVEANIHLQDNVKKELEKYSHFFDQRILGVHFRGKEMNVAQLHGYSPTPNQMIKYTKKILEEYQINKIFISTEEKNYLDLFIKEFGDKVVYTDAFRTANINSYNLINPRPNHRYLLGMDALVDFFVAGKMYGFTSRK